MKILLADDHDLVRDALGALLCKDEPSVELALCKDLFEAFEKLRTGARFDVIILDLKMPGMNGFDGARKMIECAAGTPVIIMSGSANAADVQSSIEIGARGFFSKTLAGTSLMNAVRLVASGASYVPTELLTRLPAQQNGVAKDLTSREAEVLSQLRRGGSNKEIARTLNIAETTVKLHLRSISEKLNARNRTDIIVQAIDRGIV